MEDEVDKPPPVLYDWIPYVNSKVKELEFVFRYRDHRKLPCISRSRKLLNFHQWLLSYLAAFLNKSHSLHLSPNLLQQKRLKERQLQPMRMSGVASLRTKPSHSHWYSSPDSMARLPDMLKR